VYLCGIDRTRRLKGRRKSIKDMPLFHEQGGCFSLAITKKRHYSVHGTHAGREYPAKRLIQ
ncbi:MAG: hypothetical protein ACLPKT_19290, partial [Methylocella sp.]